MSSVLKKLSEVLSFLLVGIWRVTDREVGRGPKYWFFNVIKVITLSVQRFTNDRIVTKAAALTYSILLSIVPILAIVFAIARGFGFDEFVELQLRKGFEGQTLTIETLLTFINSYLEHAKSGIFIGVGLIMLLWSVLTLTSNIERTFNQIWQVKKPRSLFRKITDYFSIFLLLPILIVVSGGLSVFMTTVVKHLEGFVMLGPMVKTLVRMIPFAFTSLMCIALYVFMPNTKVKLRHAFLPGIIAGVAFQALQYFYINSQIWLSSYNAIYGSFAAIPMFLLWTQISWSICLFGAELTYASQNVELYNFEKDVLNISRRYHDFLCVLIMEVICKRFAVGERPLTAEEISSQVCVPIRLVRETLYELIDLDLLYSVTEDEKSGAAFFLPAEDLARLSVAEVLRRIDTIGSEDFNVDHKCEYSQEWKTLAEARKGYYEHTNVLLKDL